MALTLKPSELKIFLSAAIKARHAVLIQGSPGLGKSDIVDQATKDANADLILSHPVVADPTDAKGLPWVVDGHATFLPFGDLERAMHATRLTVWFIDDLGQASAAVQAAYMQLLLARQVNGHKISDHVTFIAATNRRTDRAGVTGILEPVKSRFVSIVELAANVDEWCNWAIDANLPAEIIAYLRFQPDHLSQFSASADLTNTPTPRTWHHVARIMAMSLPPSIQHVAIAGAIGEGEATEFTAFLRLYAELPSVDQILIDPDSVAIPSNPATLYALSGALSHRATVQNFDRIGRYVTRMMNEGRGEFAVLIFRDSQRREPKIVNTTAYVRLITGPMNELVSGK